MMRQDGVGSPLAGSALGRASQRPLFVGVVLATLTAIAAFVATSMPVRDPDVWWVAAAGRDFVLRGRVPDANLYSFVDGARPWTMHEWLFAAPYAALLRALGPAAFPGITLASYATGVALLGRALLGRGRHVRGGVLLMMLVLLAFSGRLLSARPTGVALLFPLATTVVAFGPRFRTREAAACVLLELAWVNAHGSFPLGVVLLAAATASAPPGQRRTRAIATALAALATLVNPHGLALHRLVLSYLLGTEGVFRVIREHVHEFGSVARAYGGTVDLAEVLALAVLGALALSALRRPSWALRLRGALALGLLGLALLHARHIGLAGLSALPLLVPEVDALFDRAGADPAALAGARARLSMAVVAAPLAVGVACLAVGARARDEAGWIHEGDALLPLVRALPDGARVFVPFDRAGLVEWYAFPRGVRVVYDSRNDCYSEATARTFFRLEDGALRGDAAREALDAFGTDAALLTADHPLVPSLAGAFHETARRGRWVLMVRGAPPSR